MLKQYRNIVNKAKYKLELLECNNDRIQKELDELDKEINALQESREIFQKAAIITQNHLAQHLSSIVTKSLRAIWQNSDISFCIEFVERRNVTECDMFIEENGHRYSLFDSKGYGIIDVVSFSLKIAYIVLHKVDNIVIIDEPFRNLSKNKHAITSQLIKELAEELEMQFIICTHSDDLISYADKSFHIINGILKNNSKE